MPYNDSLLFDYNRPTVVNGKRYAICLNQLVEFCATKLSITSGRRINFDSIGLEILYGDFDCEALINQLLYEISKALQTQNDLNVRLYKKRNENAAVIEILDINNKKEFCEMTVRLFEGVPDGIISDSGCAEYETYFEKWIEKQKSSLAVQD